MHITDTQDDTIRYPHHKQILFTIPNAECTTVTNQRNWNCDRVISRAIVLLREEQLAADEEVVYDEEGDYGDDDDDEHDVDEGQEGPKPEGARAEEEPISPPPPFHPPFTYEIDGSSSSSAYMLLDPAFLQSFFTL